MRKSLQKMKGIAVNLEMDAVKFSLCKMPSP
jgi:hypothetical protein